MFENKMIYSGPRPFVCFANNTDK